MQIIYIVVVGDGVNIFKELLQIKVHYLHYGLLIMILQILKLKYIN